MLFGSFREYAATRVPYEPVYGTLECVHAVTNMAGACKYVMERRLRKRGGSKGFRSFGFQVIIASGPIQASIVDS